MTLTPDNGAATDAARESGRPPREDLVRAVRVGVEMRDAGQNGDGGDGSTLFGHFAVFNRWTEIDSFWEGHFLERIAPGAFKKTFREQGDKIRVLLEHGHDPQLGNKPIAEPQELSEDATGAYYEARLFDGLSPLVLDGLRAGQYGASFRFSVMREEYVEDPGTSDENPMGLPERTLKEVRVPEFGPVTFGAYSDATADVRSLTDHFILERATRQPERLREVLEYLERRDERRAEAPTSDQPPDEGDTTAPPANGTAASVPQSTDGRRALHTYLYGLTPKEDTPSWRL